MLTAMAFGLGIAVGVLVQGARRAAERQERLLEALCMAVRLAQMGEVKKPLALGGGKRKK